MQQTSAQAVRLETPTSTLDSSAERHQLRLLQHRSHILAFVVVPLSVVIALAVGLFVVLTSALGLWHMSQGAQTAMTFLPLGAFVLNFTLFSVPAWRTHRLAKKMEPLTVFDGHRLHSCRLYGWWLMTAVPCAWAGLGLFFWLMTT